MVNAIDSGFKAADYLYGVAMVPKPKQESWLLCALKDDPYVGCQPLEDESGNDDAPRALKAMLRDVVGFEPSVDEMCEWITTRRFDSSRVQMASFERFKESLTQAIRALQAR
ncbi:hypothetical protein D7Y53_19190 [Stenotrophomonas maltophilia]|nr:hypothetical protein [Stenotrophomonas maltophilia]